MVNKSDLPAIARAALVDLLDREGFVLYSSHETIQAGDAYFLGYNPGGTGGRSLKDSLPEMLTNTENAYLDGSWDPRGKLLAPGRAPMQLRTVHVLESLGLVPRDVCASNLIFVRSTNSSGVELAMGDTCWPVHEAMLDIVQPRLIVSCGNSATSAFGYLLNRFGGLAISAPSGHRGYSLKHFDAQINGRRLRVLGLPHLSWYKPQGRPEFAEWAKQVTQV